MTILDTIIADPATTPCVRRFLSSASTRTKHHNDNATLFATYRGERVRVVATLPTGRVGITSDIAAPYSAERFVRLSDLDQPMPTLYPAIHPRRRPRSVTEVLPWVAELANCYVDDILSVARTEKLQAARAVAAGMMRAVNRKLSITDIAGLLHRNHSTVTRTLAELGLVGGVTDFDRPFLQAIWRTGTLSVGHGPGEIPDAVLCRLAELVSCRNGRVEVAAVQQLRDLAFAESVAVDAADDADEDLTMAMDMLAIETEREAYAETKEQLQCAA